MKSNDSKKKSDGVPKRDAALHELLKLLDKHPKRAKLIKVGKSTDQLARALVPLMVAKGKEIEISSVTMEKFWKLHGSKIQATRLAKALREHVGYARNTRTGKVITPNGEKYLEVVMSISDAAKRS